ncbi:MAG: RnfABCDGE type electron transport complex subunit D [Alphaproteobacteria bacterium]
MKQTIFPSPHIIAKHNVSSIMKDVIIALIPAFFASLVFFGINALRVILTSVASCVLFEYLFAKYILKTKNTVLDYSAIITGLLLAFSLPANIATAMIVIGSFVAIVVAKMAFGGLGKNLFNPAVVGVVFLFISFPVAMSASPAAIPFDFLNVEETFSITTLNILKDFSDVYSLPFTMDLFLGNESGCLGQTSVLAICLGFAYLLFRRVISWHIPVFYVGTVFVFCSVAYFFTGSQMYNPVLQSMSGALMLGAVFMATDYVTSPMAKKGKAIFAIGCGLLTCLIRFYGAYPEGVFFAILIMNAFVPIIDKHFHNKFFGAKK